MRPWSNITDVFINKGNLDTDSHTGRETCDKLWEHMVWSSGQRGRKGSEWIGMQNPETRAKTIFYLPHCKTECFAKTWGWNQTQVDTVIVPLKFKMHISFDSAIALVEI